MTSDPRVRNRRFSDHRNAEGMKAEYLGWLHESISGVDGEALSRAIAALEAAAAAGKRLYAIGNGGSAAIVDHLCADINKGTHFDGDPPIRATALVSNVSLYTAVANDFGFENVFVKQLEFLADAGDVLLAVSSSGNSPNICAAVRFAKARGMTTIGLSGFDGGGLRREADIVLHADARNYGVIEDTHQALLHIIALAIIQKRASGC